MESIDIKGKAYIQVNERLKHLRKECPEMSLVSEMIYNDAGVCIFKASLIDTTGRVLATGHAYEKEDSTFINKTSYIENCETSAWGRALGNFGIGIDTSVASADEVQNAVANQKPKEEKTTVTLCTDAQIDSIKAMCKTHGVPPENIKAEFGTISRMPEIQVRILMPQIESYCAGYEK